MKRGDLVTLRHFDPEKKRERLVFRIAQVGRSTVKGQWVSGPLRGRDATIDLPAFREMRAGA